MQSRGVLGAPRHPHFPRGTDCPEPGPHRLSKTGLRPLETAVERSGDSRAFTAPPFAPSSRPLAGPSGSVSRRFDLCARVLDSQWTLVSRGCDVLALAGFYSACLDLLLYGKGPPCRPFGECLRFIRHHEHSCVLTARSNVMLGVHSSLAMWFAQSSQWDLFLRHFSKARRLVKRTNASLFGSHGFVRFLECHVLMLQRVPEGVLTHSPPEARSKTLQYFEEFFSRCVTCPVYHQWVSELKASVVTCEKRDAVSLTNILRPFDTCLTRIWIEGEFPEKNASCGKNLGKQSKRSSLEPHMRQSPHMSPASDVKRDTDVGSGPSCRGKDRPAPSQPGQTLADGPKPLVSHLDFLGIERSSLPSLDNWVLPWSRWVVRR